MIKDFANCARLMLAALVLPAAAMTAAVVPVSAQAAVEAGVARAIAESLVEAVNGGRSDRRLWGRDHLGSDGLRDSEVEKLDRLARRHGTLTLGQVQSLDGAIVLGVTAEHGRSGTIQLNMDRSSDKVLTISTSGL